MKAPDMGGKEESNKSTKFAGMPKNTSKTAFCFSYWELPNSCAWRLTQHMEPFKGEIKRNFFIPPS